MVDIVNDAAPDLKVTAAEDIVPVTPANADLPSGECRGLLLDADGTVDIVTLSGATRTSVPLVKGWNPIGVQRVTAATAGVWAVY